MQHVTLAKIRNTSQPPGAGRSFQKRETPEFTHTNDPRLQNSGAWKPRPQNGTSEPRKDESKARRYTSRVAARPRGGTDHRPQPRHSMLVRHSRHHPRLRTADAAYGPGGAHGAARGAASATRRRPVTTEARSSGNGSMRRSWGPWCGSRCRGWCCVAGGGAGNWPAAGGARTRAVVRPLRACAS